jgi:hypothetical protein
MRNEGARNKGKAKKRKRKETGGSGNNVPIIYS